MAMAFTLHAATKEYIDDKCATLEAEAERLKREAEEAANLAEVVRYRNLISLLAL
jgi:hypothetical protein